MMNCVTLVKYRIRVNEELTEEFASKRGLQQGDPTSPYLFLLCAEGFLALLSKEEMEGRIHGVLICRNALTVSHLLFADDSLILCKANGVDVVHLKEILMIYEDYSGQVINTEKPVVMFSPNTRDEQRRRVREIMSIGAETRSEKYLGLPVFVGRSKTNVFTYLKECVWQRTQGWKEKFLSKARKEILIKAVAQAVPVFAMGCFDNMKEMCNQICVIIAKY